ncbi:DUF4396 domain-containing protein [Streptomyces sp. NPDC048639]|uniref:DUF4396 domain-containing protein n=1 Tax=Streptomyces sp. NPDC048639 TaxID=3365581 RepID=UPI003717BDFB
MEHVNGEHHVHGEPGVHAERDIHGEEGVTAEQNAHDEQGGHHQAAADWPTAARATVHCLTGCAIGEIVGMAIGTALAWHNAPTMALAIVLAFLFGYSLTLFAVLRAGLDWKSALKVALAADTVSIAVMELVDNGIIAVTPGAMEAELSDGLFWGALALGFLIAFLITTPVNKWMIGRGKGHAVMHEYHH